VKFRSIKKKKRVFSAEIYIEYYHRWAFLTPGSFVPLINTNKLNNG